MTKKLIKFFYMAGMEISTVCILCALADDFNLEPGRHLANMIFAPVLAVVLVGFVRVQSEIVRALSRTTEYTRTVAANLKGAGRLSFQMDLGNIDLAKPTIGNRQSNRVFAVGHVGPPTSDRFRYCSGARK